MTPANCGCAETSSRSTFTWMTEEGFKAVLSGDCDRIEEALTATHFSDFMDRPRYYAEIIARATNEEMFPKKHRSSRALYLADSIIAAGCNSSVRYMRLVFKRQDPPIDDYELPE
jgi:hypothetical protein